MINGAGNGPAQTMNPPVTTATGVGSAGAAGESATDTKFGDVWKQIQAQYGAKPQKAREIKKQLGKDDFLRIMITQMQHQDPTQPFSAEKFATEMAQFTSVEQLQNLNQGIAKLGENQKPLERLTMTSMIGKTVTVDRERFPHTENENSSLAFTLPKDAKQTTITILSENGETLLRKDLGPAKKGENTFAWDGVKANTLPAKSGNYMFRIEAKDDKGMSINTSPQATARVVGVSFEGSEPVFLVGDPKQPSKVMMRNIVRVESDGSASAVPGAQSLAAASAGAVPAQASAPGESAPNFFTFQKGVGSKSIEAPQLSPEALARLSPEAREALQARAALTNAADAPRAAAAPARSPASDAGEQGFPNGLAGE